VASDEPNYLAEAFKSQYNLIGLGTALGFAVLSLSPLPLIVALGTELVVLPLVSGSGRFQRLVRARRSEEKEAQQQAKNATESSEMLQFMPEAERQHYRRLQSVAEEIRQNYRGMTETSQMLLEQLVDKLDFLLAFYLRMRYSLTRYQAYFNTTNPEHIQERMAMLDHEMQKGPKKVHEIKRRTRAVLEKRLLRYQKALENRELIQAQTETIQEVLHLLRDQSYAMRDPRSIAEQLDGLVISAEETERGVKDMEEILTLEQEPVLAGSLTAEIEAELEAGRAAMSEAPPVAVPTPAQQPRPRPTTQNAPPPPPRRSKLTQRH
jgi:hypothetical protein